MQKLEAVIGATFDMTVKFYPEEYAILKWRKPYIWNEEITYNVNNAVIASNADAYKAIVENKGVNPVTGSSGHWEKLTPLNLEGYSAEMKIRSGGTELTLATSGKGIVLGGTEGTVAIKAKYSQTTEFPSGDSHFYLFLTDASENKYDYLDGTIKWKLP